MSGPLVGFPDAREARRAPGPWPASGRPLRLDPESRTSRATTAHPANEGRARLRMVWSPGGAWSTFGIVLTVIEVVAMSPW